jgi:hypothetical protein
LGVCLPPTQVFTTATHPISTRVTQSPPPSPHQNDAAYISSDGGRVCRPLIICDAGVPRVTEAHIEKLKRGEWGFQDFLERGERLFFGGVGWVWGLGERG